MSDTTTKVSYEQESYQKHANWYNQHYPDQESKVHFYKQQMQSETGTIASWLQDQFFHCLDPLLCTPSNWLTVGDAYGFDARYLISKGSKALATDLNTDFLVLASRLGVVQEYESANAEQLPFSDAQFDHVCCKESYHHFPRPYAGLYEMIRVAKKSVVLMEPNDPISRMPMLLWLTNIFAPWPRVQHRIWKNRFSHEPVGNFVYKVSERELEKFAAALHLPMVAFKYINPNFFRAEHQYKEASFKCPAYVKLRLKKVLLDVLMRFHILPGQVLSAVIFKQFPDEQTLKSLKLQGYKITRIPLNPYLKMPDFARNKL